MMNKSNDIEYIGGKHVVAAAIHGRRRAVHRLCLSKNLQRTTQKRFEAMAKKADIPIEHLSNRALSSLCPIMHQGVVAAAAPVPVLDEPRLMELVEQKAGSLTLVLLDGVEDPHNLGAVVRSCVLFGVDVVITQRRRSASPTPVAQKSAAGGFEHIHYVEVTNLVRTMKRLKHGEAGVWLVGLSSDGTASLAAEQLPERLGFVLGGEGKGLRRLVRENCDLLLRIPTTAHLDSLNVSTAAAIALYERFKESRSSEF